MLHAVCSISKGVPYISSTFLYIEVHEHDKIIKSTNAPALKNTIKGINTSITQCQQHIFEKKFTVGVFI